MLTAEWLNTWSCRLGVVLKKVLRRTLERSRGMSKAEARLTPLSVLGDAHMRRKAFSGTMPRASSPLAVTHMDLFQISKKDIPPGGGSMRYALVVVDDYSRHVSVYFAKRKDRVKDLIGMYYRDMGGRALAGTQFVLHPGLRRQLHCDGGTEFVSDEVSSILADLGLSGAVVTCAPDSPAANGLAERMIGLLATAARAHMHAARGRVPPSLWHYAWMHAAHCRNKLATQRRVNKRGEVSWVSPHELFFGTKPDLSHIVAFGSPCRVLKTGPEKTAAGKLRERTGRGTLLVWGGDGVQIGDNSVRVIFGYVVLMDDGRVVYTREVDVDESDLLAVGISPFLPDRADAAGLEGNAASSAPTHLANAGSSAPTCLADLRDDDDVEADDDDLRSDSDAEREHVTEPQGQSHSLDDSVTEPQGQSHSLEENSKASSDASSEEGEDPQRATDEGTPPRRRGGRRGRRASISNELGRAPAMLDLGFDPLRRDRASRSKAAQQSDGAARPNARASRSTAAQQSDGAARANAALVILAVAAAAGELAPVMGLYDGEWVEVPDSYAKAVQSRHWKHWKQAIEEHLAGLERLGTFEETVVKKTTHSIPTKWVFAIKTDSAGLITRFKARLVAKGFMQKQGIDYDEVFSPAIRAEQVRMLLAVGTQHAGRRFAHAARSCGGQVCQLSFSDFVSKGDYKDAFHIAELDPGEQVYINFPQGYTPRLSAHEGHKVVGRAKKAVPGLKQASRRWYEHLRGHLVAMGFTPCSAAPCIYVKETASGFLVIGVFVDDMLMVNLSDDKDAFSTIREALLEHYVISFDGSLSKFLGAEFEETKEGLFMHSNQRIGELLSRFEITGGTKDTPESQTEPTPETEMLLGKGELRLYQEMTGALMYLTCTTRPDIAHATNMLARRMSRPRVHDLQAARRVLRYLAGTPNRGILFRFEDDPFYPGLVAYADSDWANDPVKRKSTSGYIVMFNGAPISWHSGLQSIIALSTCEAEYVSLSDAVRELSYLREIAHFLRQDVSQPTTVFEDNQGTIDLVNNPVHHRRTKHIDVKYHYIRAKQDAGEVVVQKIPTERNLADIFTKSTTRDTFRRLVSDIMHDRVLRRDVHTVWQ